MRVVWRAAAVADAKQALAYGKARWPTAAVAFAQELAQASEQISTHPLSGREGMVDGTRELVIRHHPFVMVYVVQAERVVVLRLFHQAQQIGSDQLISPTAP